MKKNRTYKEYISFMALTNCRFRNEHEKIKPYENPSDNYKRRTTLSYENWLLYLDSGSKFIESLPIPEDYEAEVRKINNEILSFEFYYIVVHNLSYSDKHLKHQLQKLYSRIPVDEEWYLPHVNDMLRERGLLRTFTIDISDVDPDEADAYMQKIAAKFKK